MQHTVLIATELTDESLERLRGESDVNVQSIAPRPELIAEHIGTAYALIARDDVIVDAALLAAAPQLRIVARVGPGLSGIDLAAATNRGIIVMNTPGTNAVAAGEHTLALMLALSRRLVIAHDSLRQG